MSTDTVDNWVSEWSEKVNSLIEETNEDEIRVDPDDYSVRELQNGDYAISTPGKTYLVSEDNISEHPKGRTAEGYDLYDQDIEEEIREMLEGQLQ
jgi:hypothetical protein